MTDVKDMLKRVQEVFGKAFGRTPLMQRVDDIQKEATELTRFTDMRNLREEAGDLLASLLALYNETEWDPAELLEECLSKIERRITQYNSLGRKKCVAILGGAFDPPTEGHIAVAKHVLESSSAFDEVWLMPCYQHMYNKNMVSPEHRIKMCEIAAEGYGNVQVSNYEIEQRLAGETYQLIKCLSEEDFAKHQYDFSFIIGMDNATTFERWVNFRELERMARFVIVMRPGIETPDKTMWYHKSPHIVLPKSRTLLEMSSTMARKAFAEGSVPKHINPGVAEYIKEHQLYRTQLDGEF